MKPCCHVIKIFMMFSVLYLFQNAIHLKRGSFTCAKKLVKTSKMRVPNMFSTFWQKRSFHAYKQCWTSKTSKTWTFCLLPFRLFSTVIIYHQNLVLFLVFIKQSRAGIHLMLQMPGQPMAHTMPPQLWNILVKMKHSI